MFSSSDTNPLSLEGYIPVGSIEVAVPLGRDRRSDSLSMPPPPLPTTTLRSVEMQIGMGLRTSIAAFSLLFSYRAPAALAAVLGRAVMSLGPDEYS